MTWTGAAQRFLYNGHASPPQERARVANPWLRRPSAVRFQDHRAVAYTKARRLLDRQGADPGAPPAEDVARGVSPGQDDRRRGLAGSELGRQRREGALETE